MKPYKVYKIQTTERSGNAYFVNREERWSVVADKDFEDELSARNYVVTMNLKHTELAQLAWRNKDADELVDRFCFGPEFYHRRRYFLGEPDVDLIRRSLEKNGVKVFQG